MELAERSDGVRRRGILEQASLKAELLNEQHPQGRTRKWVEKEEDWWR